MATLTCKFGAPITMYGIFKNSVDALADPDNVYLIMYPPGAEPGEDDEERVIYPASRLSHPSTGNYNMVYTMDKLGTWKWLYVGVGTVAAQSPINQIVVEGVEV